MENRPLRIMPNNQEAEQSVIGSMILDKNYKKMIFIEMDIRLFFKRF